MEQSCWRVAIRVYRRDVHAQTHIVEREGPIIQAASSAEATARALLIFEGNMDFASVGAATYLHTGHRNVAVGAIESRPSPSPELELPDQLARMAATIRKRRGH